MDGVHYQLQVVLMVLLISNQHLQVRIECILGVHMVLLITIILKIGLLQLLLLTMQLLLLNFTLLELFGVILLMEQQMLGALYRKSLTYGLVLIMPTTQVLIVLPVDVFIPIGQVLNLGRNQSQGQIIVDLERDYVQILI